MEVDKRSEEGTGREEGGESTVDMYNKLKMIKKKKKNLAMGASKHWQCGLEDSKHQTGFSEHARQLAQWTWCIPGQYETLSQRKGEGTQGWKLEAVL